jgi:hypothetical protein
VAETAFDEMLMGVMRALCEFALPVTQQTPFDQSLKELDDAHKGFYQMKGIFREQKCRCLRMPQ